MSTRRNFLSGIPAILYANDARSAERPRLEQETLQDILNKLRDKINEDLPDLTSIQITYDPKNQKVPLMVLALRV